MNKNFINFSLFAFFVFTTVLYFACKSPRENQRPSDQGTNTEDLIRNQQMIVKEEAEDIENYIARRNLLVDATETGLRYHITSSSANGKKVMDEMHVLIDYKVALLDGSVVYDSDSMGTMEIKVGKSEVASGLQEGLKLMNEGDKALFIIPSHLAYGLTGDGDRIKQYQALVVNVDSLKIISE